MRPTSPAILSVILLACAFSATVVSAEPDKPKDDAVPKDVPAESALSGTKWKLKSWSEKNLDPANFEITAAFRVISGKTCVSGRGGVNTYTAVYEAKADGSFTVGTIGSTERVPNEGETLYMKLLPQVRKYAIDGDHLVFCDEKGKVLLGFEKD